MIGLLTYILRVAVVMAVFYLFYRLLLSRETFHRLNRVVLLVTALLSFVLPLCIITVTRTVEMSAFALGEGLTVPEADLTITEQGTPAVDTLRTLVALLYGVGALGVLVWNMVNIFSLRRLLRRGRKAVVCGEPVTIVEQQIAPFSWFRHIVLSEQDAEECATMVVAHERAHVNLRHSWDSALVDLCCAAQWFNPAMWLLRSDLKDIHEFEADAEVLRSGIDARSYQILLIKKTVGNKSYSIANSLNHSTLKKRITMMLSKKSSAASRWKLLYTLPVVALSLTAFAEQRTNLVVRDDSDNKVTQNSDNVKTDGNYIVFSEKDGRDTMNVRLSLEITDDGGQLFTGSQSALKAFSAHFAGENAIYMDLDKIYEGAEDVDAKDLTIYGPEGSAVISVDFEGNYQLNGQPSSLKAIGKQLAKWRGTPDEPKSILISAWRDCPVDYTVALKEVLRENGQLRITTIYQEDFDISFDGVDGALYKLTVE